VASKLIFGLFICIPPVIAQARRAGCYEFITNFLQAPHDDGLSNQVQFFKLAPSVLRQSGQRFVRNPNNVSAVIFTGAPRTNPE
jgi:hypothetical protein